MTRPGQNGAAARRFHWPEYLMEAAELAIFMLSACTFAVLLEHPSSPLPGLVPSTTARRVIMGLAMGFTAIGLVYSPFGRRSGAHMNPSVTLTFVRLKRIAPLDAVGYVLAQCAGAIAGVFAARLLLGRLVMSAPINHVATLPGRFGVGAAFAAEVGISFILMAVLLAIPSSSRWSRFTGICAGMLVSLFIAIEAPVSGMSMNPARSLGSAFWSDMWDDLWLYFTAPPLGMLLAAELIGRIRTGCAKLCHDPAKPCIFCDWVRHRGERGDQRAAAASSRRSGVSRSGMTASSRRQSSAAPASSPTSR